MNVVAWEVLPVPGVPVMRMLGYCRMEGEVFELANVDIGEEVRMRRLICFTKLLYVRSMKIG